MKICSRLEAVKPKGNYFALITNCIEIRLYFFTDHILRIRAGFDGDFQEGSYSLITTAWDDITDPIFHTERRRIHPASASVEETETQVILRGRYLTVTIDRDPFRICVTDPEGFQLHADIPDLAYMEDSNHRRIHTSELSHDDHFYGFGEKSGDFNKAESFMAMSPKDAMGYNPVKTDSLYKYIPFYIRLNDRSRKAVGYFYHNTSECDFDLGREHSNYWKPHSRYRADGGDIDLFLIAGPSIREIVKRYTSLTGTSALLPKYALGYLGSSMYYAELPRDCDDEILDFIDTTRKNGIPIDGFQLSSGYTSQDTPDGEKRCVFTWNRRRFKDPADFFARMKKRGITVSPNVKPGILLQHPRLKEFTSAEVLVKASDSNQPAVGTWWGGKGVFVDFTNPKARAFWKKELRQHLLDYGTTSVWNDNCEYDSIVDKDSHCCYEGRGCTIGYIKPVMSNLMCQVTAETICEVDADTRPYIVCRSGYAGIQRYAQTWAGDNLTCWDSLRYNIGTILGMSLCGVSNYGADIGGFYGPAPEPELFVRWVQNGIFQPRFSIHSVNTDNTVTEPWMYPAVSGLIQEAIRFRYRLFPYYYSLMARSHEEGLPVLEPFCSAFQQDTSCYDDGINFMVGDSLLVANVVEKGASEKLLYLPSGSDFYDFYSRICYHGGQTVSLPVTLESIPLFIKSGAILPLAGNQISSLTTESITSLVLLCCADRDGSFTLYEDDGISNRYLSGEYRKTQISMHAGERTVFRFTHRGSYVSPIADMALDIIHPDRAPYWVALDQEILPHFLQFDRYEQSEAGWYYDQTTKSVQVKYKKPAEDYTLTVSFEVFDMIGM